MQCVVISWGREDFENENPDFGIFHGVLIVYLSIGHRVLRSPRGCAGGLNILVWANSRRRTEKCAKLAH
jgi:hypothetical protein